MERKSKAFDTALSLVQAEIIAEKTKVVVVEKPKPSTQIIDLTDIQVRAEQTLLELEGEGVLEKFLVRSPSSNFSIVLTTEKASLEGDYAHFEDVCAYQENSTYVLEITNIWFQQKIRLVLRVGEPINFSKVFIRYAIAKPF